MTTSNDQSTSRQIASVARTTTVRVARLPFLDLCTEAKRFADAKSTMPILATALLQVEGDKLRVAATDLLLTVDAKMPVTVNTDLIGSLPDFATVLEASVSSGLCAEQSAMLPPPSVGINAKKLHEVVKALPSDAVDVVIQEKLELVETDTYRADKTRVCSVCRNRSASANGANDTCINKPKGHAAVCGGKLLDTSRDVTRTIEVSLLSSKSRFNLRSLTGRDFPKLPKVDAWLWHRIDAAVLREVLGKVAPTISQDSTHSHLNGALLEVSTGLIRVVSTDGHRLTKVDRAVTTTFSTAHCPQKGFVLPLPGVTELLKFLPTLIGKPKKGIVVAPAEVEIALTGASDYHWRKPGSEVVYTQKLESAQFPPYDQVIPHEVEKLAVVSRIDLLAVTKRIMISASEKTAGLKFTLHGQEDGGTLQPVSLTLSTDNPDVGDASEELDNVMGTRCYEWNKMTKPNERGGVDKVAKMLPFVFGVNGKYLVAALDEMTAATIYMGFNGELDPMTLRAAKDDADVVVIMPMRL
jgi:DNA polymerase-3 subunit beta